MRTIKIDILNEKALKLLKDLEALKLIRLKEDKATGEKNANYWTRYKGAMTKQTPTFIDQQLNELREEWE